jgi:serine/threonine protein kinase/Tol biopolymer transport system component
MTGPFNWKDVKELLYKALEQEPHERATFLQKVCGEDSALRAELESLLAAHQEAGSFVEDAVFADLTDSAALAMTRLFFHHGDTLKSGDRLGIYEITEFLAAGGMGEVYRARDTKLGRDVAIKVLPRLFTFDSERLKRFEQEAHVLATLNHPNIATIYAMEEREGACALVMEFVEGQTLAERLKRTRLPLDETMRIARQIAEALESAHEKGIVHRDLKPANIKIKPDGTVKVLDFGVAKLIASSQIEQGLRSARRSEISTVTDDATGHGVIVGTAAYMSPEQASGQAVNKRADIWAFGCVLYEMLTGSPAFAADTSAEIIPAVLERVPSWDALPNATPLPVRRLLLQCLNKDSTRRLRDIGDARLALEEPTELITVPPPRRAMRFKMAAAALVVTIIAFLAGWLLVSRQAHQTMRLPLELGVEAVNDTNGSETIAISPDGTQLVYRARDVSNKIRLFVRALDQNLVTPLPGTEDGLSPFFSPDGQSVAFFAQGKLKKISLQGGNPVDLCDIRDARGGSWGEDGNIIAGIEAKGPLYRIPSGGGMPQPITELKHAVTHRWPQVLPGTNTIVFTSNDFVGDFDRATIEIQSLKTGERKTLVHGAYYGRYVPTGHLLYIHGGTLYAVPVNIDRLELAGPAMAVIKDVRSRLSSGGAILNISRNGTLIYTEGNELTRRLAWLDRSGHIESLRARADVYPIHFSPDGKRVALAKNETGGLDVWIYEWERDAWTRLTSSPDIESYPAWSPDGKHLAFETGSGGISWMRADGTGDVWPLITNSSGKAYDFQKPYSFSPDGKWMVFVAAKSAKKGDLWALPFEEAQSDHPKVGKPFALVNTNFYADAPTVSPDGRWLAYQSNETNADQVYVRSFPEAGGKWSVSPTGGSNPIWAKSGPELFYRGPEGMMVVSYKVHGQNFEPAAPRLLIAKKDLSPFFDVAPDGKRFMIVENHISGDSASPSVTLVLNFFDELRRFASSTNR